MYGNGMSASPCASIIYDECVVVKQSLAKAAAGYGCRRNGWGSSRPALSNCAGGLPISILGTVSDCIYGAAAPFEAAPFEIDFPTEDL